MPTIDALPRADVLFDTDEIPLFSPTQRDTRKVSLPQLAAYFDAVNEGETDETVYTLPTVANGFTVAPLPAVSGAGVWAQLTLSSTASTMTVILPGLPDRAQDQEVLVTVTQPVLALTVSGNGATVRGAPAVLGADGFFKMRYDSISNTWYRVG